MANVPERMENIDEDDDVITKDVNNGKVGEEIEMVFACLKKQPNIISGTRNQFSL